MTIVLSARRRMTASRHTVPFVLADPMPQMTMKTTFGIEGDPRANHGGRVARRAADCTQTCRILRMHIAKIFPPISVAEVTGISAGSHDYSKLVASRPRSTVCGNLVKSREPVPRTNT